MNLDDESHLSAYLDDELDPADRLAVEWSIESSPPLADQLRSIAQARDLVAGLDRPALPRDLAPAVGAQIASDRRRARHRSPARVAVALAGFSAFSAVAASLLFALIRLHPSLHETPDRPSPVAISDQPRPQDQPAPSPRTHTIARSAPATIPAPLARQAVSRPAPTVASAEPPSEPAGGTDRRLIGEILRRSHVRRVVIVTDVIDASEQVRHLIAQGARETPEFGRISIGQEIVIDPDHAEAAEVFAVPIDERGRRSFVDRLQKSFPELIEEGRSSPELVDRLGRVGQVAVFRGLKAAPLGDPPGDLPAFIANRERESDPFVLEANQSTPEPPRADRPSHTPRPEMARAEGGPPSPADAGFVGPPDSRGKTPPRPGERVTLLVWITRPGRR